MAFVHDCANLSVEAIQMFKSGKIEIASFCFWLDTKFHPCYQTFHNYGIYLIDHAAYWPCGKNRYFVKNRINYAPALRYLLKAYRCNAGKWKNEATIGDVYYLMHKYRDALSFYERANLCTNNSAFTAWKMGIAYMALQDYENACNCFIDSYKKQEDSILQVLSLYSCVRCGLLRGNEVADDYAKLKNALSMLCSEMMQGKLSDAEKGEIEQYLAACISICYDLADYHEVIYLAKRCTPQALTANEQKMAAFAQWQLSNVLDENSCVEHLSLLADEKSHFADPLDCFMYSLDYFEI